jgi:hypothetical protein
MNTPPKPSQSPIATATIPTFFFNFSLSSGFHLVPRRTELLEEADLVAAIPAKPEARASLRQTLGPVGPLIDDPLEAIQTVSDE